MPDLRHTDRILMLGSCFTDEVGLRLTADMFDVVHNPFGEQYNPLSVAYALQRILDRRSFSVDELVRDDSGVWHSWWLHSRFSSTDASRLLSRANDALELAGALAKKSDNSGRLWIMVTFGTAFCYSLVGDSGEKTVVANCHKFRPSLFECKRLDVEDIVGIWM
ncbi:MAG: GSCFA domain-containing protein, partial [Muribaculaceae bacterium]|nr:GSCFA domain-containing protein [Muribaculaceae bacterium]